METIIRNVDEIEAHDREALEHVLGQSLRQNQQLVIGIRSLPSDETLGNPPNGGQQLPSWCDVYVGLTDHEITALEEIVLQRADLSRPSE